MGIERYFASLNMTAPTLFVSARPARAFEYASPARTICQSVSDIDIAQPPPHNPPLDAKTAVGVLKTGLLLFFYGCGMILLALPQLFELSTLEQHGIYTLALVQKCSLLTTPNRNRKPDYRHSIAFHRHTIERTLPTPYPPGTRLLLVYLPSHPENGILLTKGRTLTDIKRESISRLSPRFLLAGSLCTFGLIALVIGLNQHLQKPPARHNMLNKHIRPPDSCL